MNHCLKNVFTREEILELIREEFKKIPDYDPNQEYNESTDPVTEGYGNALVNLYKTISGELFVR